MDGFLPSTKSFFGNVRLCPYKAYQHKVMGIKSRTGKAALIGITVHQLVASIRLGLFTLEAFLAHPCDFFDDGPFSDDEFNDIVRMVQTAFDTDPYVMSDDEKARVRIEQYFAIDVKGRLTRGKPEAYHHGSDQKSITNKARPIFHGSIDRLFERDDASLVIDDLKTGFMHIDNPVERRGYVLGGKALFPGVRRVTFGYHYLRTGKYEAWHYAFTI